MDPVSLPTLSTATVAQKPFERFAAISVSPADPLFNRTGEATVKLDAFFKFLDTPTSLDLVGADAGKIVAATQQAWFKAFENEFPTETRLKFEKEGNPSREFLELMKSLGHLEAIDAKVNREVTAAVVLGGTLAAHLNRLTWLEQNLVFMKTDTVILNGADRKILPSETELAFSNALGKDVRYCDLPFIIEKSAKDVPAGQNAATSATVLQVNEALMMKYLVENTNRFPAVAAKEVLASNLSADQLGVIGRPKAGTLEALIPLAVMLGDRFSGPIDLEVISSQPFVTRQGIDVTWGIINTRPDVKLRSVEAIGSPLAVGDKNVFGVKAFLQELAKRIRIEAASKGLIEIT